ncbi:hypothetical protein ABPG77_009097 [Micractinium sp. CCAP 211/92]
MVQPPWRQEPDFGQALERAGHALATVTLGDGGRRSAFLLVFGGRRGNTLFADVLAHDVARREWSAWCERWPSAPRSYHTATVIGEEVWLCGGGDSAQVLPDVLVFNPATRTWRQAELQGEVHLLKRTAHGACIHPLRPRSILLMGGYGGPGEDFRYLNDLVEVDTAAGTVRRVQCIGSPPEPRAYHAFVACGSFCYCVAGRTHDSRLVKGKQVLVVWDANTSKWIVPGVVEGELPPRSSHRMAAVPGGAVAFGGAVDRGARSAELHLLTGQGRLSWRACQLGNTGPMPAARGAHAMEIAGGRLYVVGGYGEGKQYTADCWSLGLDAVAGCETAPLSQNDGAAKQSGGSKPAAVPEASQWREARRSCPAAAFGAGAPKRQRLAGPAKAKPAAPPSSAAAPAAVATASPSATPVACTPVATAMPAVAPPPSMPRQQQAVQPPLAAAAAGMAAALDQNIADPSELQQVLHCERAALAALQQQLRDVMRESSEAKADAATWRRKAEEEQQLVGQANSILQQRNAEMGELQRQLRAAQLESTRAESELLELRSLQRRERDRAEREAADRDKRVQQLEQELQAERGRNDRLSESVAQHTAMVAQLQKSLHEEQQRASELRVALANERESLQNALRDEQDKARQAVQQRDHCQMQLESEQRQLKNAKEMIERQQAQVREAEEKARQAQEECRRARDEAEQARRQKHAAEEAAGRARAALARIQRARELLQHAEEDMAGLGA